MNCNWFNIFSLVLITVSLACSGPRTVSLNTIRPAEISFSSSTQRLLILDRTAVEKNAINVMEGVLTGELPGEDKSGAQELIIALKNQLSYSDRFQVIIAEERINGNSITSAFPDQISWEIIQDLADKYQADAVISIELFDTDFIITKGTKSIEQSSGDLPLPSLRFYASGVGNLTTGIRLYDPRDRTIVDQQILTSSHTWENTARSIPEAIAQLTSKSDATRYLSNEIGADYAYKISPMPVRIKRSFRGKARRSPELEQGTRYADVAQWEKAIEIWKSGLDRARNKEAGYLAHNIAIGYEVLGHFEDALSWAETAYTRYGNKDSRIYVKQIRRRLSSEELAQKQLGFRESQEY